MSEEFGDAVSPDYIMHVGTSFTAAKTLLSAVELDVFTELAREPADHDALRQRLGLHPRASRDFFDALVALGFLDRIDGVYHNTPPAEHFLDRRKPSYIGGLLDMANQRLYAYWHGLTDALRTGRPQNELKSGGESFFATLYADPARLKTFLGAMTGVSYAANRNIARKFPWASYSSFVDVGTAQGNLACQVAQAHSHLEGVGFDLPPVAPIFNEYITLHGVADRLKFCAGDFFRDPLPAADVVMMGHILHDWNLEEKRLLIGKAYAAIPAGGALIVYESIIDDERRENAVGLMVSLTMLIETPGGFDYTGADCQAWMQQAGFSRTYVERLTASDSMVVGIK